MYNAPLPANYMPTEPYPQMTAPPPAEHYSAPMPPSGKICVKFCHMYDVGRFFFY